jgi:hypothetical protein
MLYLRKKIELGNKGRCSVIFLRGGAKPKRAVVPFLFAALKS